MAPKRIDPAPTRIDPVDHFAYTLEALQWWYGAHYTAEETADYVEHSCRPVPGARYIAFDSFVKHMEASTSLRDAFFVTYSSMIRTRSDQRDDYQLHLKRERRRWQDHLVGQQRRQRDVSPRASAMV